MTTETCPPAELTNQQLLHEVERLASAERGATAYLIASLAELDARRLYLGEGYSSMFVYCTSKLRLSEHAAYGRIEAARVVRRVPAVLEHIADGSITLTNLCLLAPILTAENCDALLAAARFTSKRQVEEQVAALRPKPDAPSMVRRLAEPTIPPIPSSSLIEAGLEELLLPELAPPQPASPSPPVARPAIVPLSPARYKMQFTVGQNTHDKFRRVQALMRHVTATGDAAIIVDRALTLLLADLERRRLGRTMRPRRRAPARTDSRHVPAQVRREVWARDGGQCRFVGTDGRCTACSFLELHHVTPFAAGGPTTAANLELRCRAHNLYEADLVLRPAGVPDISVGENSLPTSGRGKEWPRSGPG